MNSTTLHNRPECLITINGTKRSALFNHNATSTLDRVRATFDERGAEYGDTWRDCQWLAAMAVAREIGIGLTRDQARKIAAGVMLDIKYQRLQGGYKDDSVIDGIAYAANLAEEMRT